MPNTARPILVFTWGNPSRGDDALGPRIHDRLISDELAGVEVLTDFQLQIEHTMDLLNRERIVFVDASVAATAPFEFYRLRPAVDDSFTTHAMSPASLLATYEKVNRSKPPPAYMLSVRGYDFELGAGLSNSAQTNLAAAIAFLDALLANRSDEHWSAQARD